MTGASPALLLLTINLFFAHHPFITGYKRSVLVNITGPSIAKKIDLPPTRTNAHHLYVNLHNRCLFLPPPPLG